jgi:hypothetical protein
VTTLGDALRDFAQIADKHPEWEVFASLVSNDGWRLNFYGSKDEAEAAARAILTAIQLDDGKFDERDLHPAPFETD